VSATGRPASALRGRALPRGLRAALAGLRDPRTLLCALAAAVVAYLTLVPVATMIIASLRSNFLGGSSVWTIQHYTQTLTAPGFGTVVANSVEYAGLVAVVAAGCGFGLAWLYVRTNTPLKPFALFASLVPLIVPGILNTVAWTLLLSPKTGPVNEALRSLHLPTFDVYSMGGMVFIQSMHVTPIAFLMGVAALTSMDRTLEEAAAASGAAPLGVFGKVTLPLMRPALAGAAILIFVQSISSFEVPQLVGVPAHKTLFASQIFHSLETFPPNYGSVGVYGVVILIAAAIGLVTARRLTGAVNRETITGKGFRPSVADIGRFRWLGLGAVTLFFVLTVVLPLGMLGWASLLPTYEPPSFTALHQLSGHNYSAVLHTPNLLSSVRNSLVVSVSAAAVVTLVCVVVAYVTIKTRAPGRGALEMLATAPLGVPSIIMGISILYWYLVIPVPLHLYGTLAILVVAFVTIGLPYGLRYLVPGMAQIKSELEEASLSSGANWRQTLTRIYLPLLVPSITASFLYTFIVAFREISSAIFLYTQGTQVVSVSVYDLWDSGEFSVVAALGIVMVAILGLAVVAVSFVGRRFGVRPT
jgi:iron(III) transport system permease protein